MFTYLTNISYETYNKILQIYSNINKLLYLTITFKALI